MFLEDSGACKSWTLLYWRQADRLVHRALLETGNCTHQCLLQAFSFFRQLCFPRTVIYLGSPKWHLSAWGSELVLDQGQYLETC